MPDSPRVIQVAVPRPLHAVYDYSVPEGMPLPEPGARISVPFGHSKTVGVCVAHAPESPHAKLKDVFAVIDETAVVPESLMDLARWMTTYYHYPLGEVLATMLPAAARKGAACEIQPADVWQSVTGAAVSSRAKAQRALLDYLAEAGPTSGADIVAAGYRRDILRTLIKAGHVARADEVATVAYEQPPSPNPDQADAIAAITASLGSFAAYLLEGVTGSGKTEVYLRSIEPVVNAGRQVLVLVPEIALTPQTLARFQRRFARVGMLHSNLTDHERLQTWLKCRRGDIDVLIGTRSAVFTPFADLGLIVVDEEHDSSYKQQEGLRYSARDLAAKRAQDCGVPVVFGTATPSLESLYNVELGRYQLLHLHNRAGGASMPEYRVIDMRGQTHTDGISLPLERVMRRHLDAGGQALVFLNRRGYAPTLLCAACGWQAMCPDCDARLTLHRAPAQMVCHHCLLKLEIPRRCESCGQESLLPVGLGTQRTEAGLRALFADLPVYRIDRDTTRSNQRLEAQFAKINEGKPCIMVGTQMLAKGHHFPNVTLVAVLNADAGFSSPDFRAPERTAQLIVQVAGRAGRAERPGQVWIQSYQPESPVLETLIKEGYPGFARAELASRVKLGLPPARPMALLRADAPNGHDAQRLLESCKTHLREGGANLELLGPVAAPLGRLANRSRFQLMVIGADRRALHSALKRLPRPKLPRDLRWSIDIDPYDSL